MKRTVSCTFQQQLWFFFDSFRKVGCFTLLVTSCDSTLRFDCAGVVGTAMSQSLQAQPTNRFFIAPWHQMHQSLFGILSADSLEMYWNKETICWFVVSIFAFFFPLSSALFGMIASVSTIFGNFEYVENKQQKCVEQHVQPAKVMLAFLCWPLFVMEIRCETLRHPGMDRNRGIVSCACLQHSKGGNMRRIRFRVSQFPF